MPYQPPLYEVTERDKELAREIKGNPSGPHRPDVVRLINRLFWAPMPGRIVLVCIKDYREWKLGRLSGVRGKPIELINDQTYTDRGEAEWAVLELRWETITGHSLDID